ncbi:MAG: RNA-processing protein [Candidatus Pacearchaeota archaeon]|nr:MAG: RNA-processing protein [Candidatus Pacearchaeota archaeon]
MEKIFFDKISRILKNRKRLEDKLKVKIVIHGNYILIEGEPEKEYIAKKVLDALNFGFPLSVAFLIKDKDFEFEELNIKDYTKRKDLSVVRARIIGKKGKTFRTLNQLTNCFFEIKGNRVGIVGEPEYIKNAQNSIISLVRGAKQANVYHFLEKHRVKPVFDFGLKEIKKPKPKKKKSFKKFNSV